MRHFAVYTILQHGTRTIYEYNESQHRCTYIFSLCYLKKTVHFLGHFTINFLKKKKLKEVKETCHAHQVYQHK